MEGYLRAKELEELIPGISWMDILEEHGEGTLLACGDYYQNELFHEGVRYKEEYALDF